MIDVRTTFNDAERLARSTPNALAQQAKGSEILKIAAEVRGRRAAGETVRNFTIGDFDPSMFPIPDILRDRVAAELAAGQTNYPPEVGLPELRDAIVQHYAEHLGLLYPEDCVLVGSGARPPIYAAYHTILEAGDSVVYPVPCWNVPYYVALHQAVGVPVVTRPERGFLPTVEDLLPHLGTARMLVLNSPLNPCGTVISSEMLRDVSLAVVAENDRRRAAGERPLILLYDQVYWQLVYGDRRHVTPVGLVPEVAPYTILVDAISKSWAATGLRVGWAVAPPWIRSRMASLIGHMGAWAGRAEQRATATLLADPSLVAPWMTSFRGALQARLVRLHDGLRGLRDEGLPVDCLDAEGALYLSARFDLGGRVVDGAPIRTDDDARRALLGEADTAIVPFTAFGYPPGTGWVRFSVGAVDLDDVDRSVEALRRFLRRI